MKMVFVNASKSIVEVYLIFTRFIRTVIAENHFATVRYIGSSVNPECPEIRELSVGFEHVIEFLRAVYRCRLIFRPKGRFCKINRSDVLGLSATQNTLKKKKNNFT